MYQVFVIFASTLILFGNSSIALWNSPSLVANMYIGKGRAMSSGTANICLLQ